MIEPSKVNATFIQHCGSCVLASYAIVNNCLASVEIENVFQDYCRHFKIPFQSGTEAERLYGAHFDREWKRQNCKGYEIILKLHYYSEAETFRIGRETFDATFYPESTVKLTEIEDGLRIKRSLLNVTYQPGPDFHSVTVFHDPTGMVVRDTNCVGLKRIPKLSSLGNLRDSVLYVAK